MTSNKLEQQAVRLAEQASSMNQEERQKLHPEIRRLVASLKSCGSVVPRKLQQINQDLNEDALEEMFDNLPV